LELDEASIEFRIMNGLKGCDYRGTFHISANFYIIPPATILYLNSRHSTALLKHGGAPACGAVSSRNGRILHLLSVGLT